MKNVKYYIIISTLILMLVSIFILNLRYVEENGKISWRLSKPTEQITLSYDNAMKLIQVGYNLNLDNCTKYLSDSTQIKMMKDSCTIEWVKDSTWIRHYLFDKEKKNSKK